MVPFTLNPKVTRVNWDDIHREIFLKDTFKDGIDVVKQSINIRNVQT